MRLRAFNTSTGAHIQSFPTTGGGRGIAVIGTKIYYTSPSNPHVFITDSVTHADLGIAFTVPHVAGIGTLAWDGASFWLTPYGGKAEIYQYSPVGTLLNTIPLSGCEPGARGLCWRDGMEIANGRIIANRLDGIRAPDDPRPVLYDLFDLNGNLLRPAFITPSVLPTSSATGIAFDGSCYYVMRIRESSLDIFDSNGSFVRNQKLDNPNTQNTGEDLSVVHPG